MNRISVFIALLFCCFTIAGMAQKKIKSPDLKMAISYPYVFGNFQNTDSNVNASNMIIGFPSLSVEKPFSIEYKRRNRFSINPGLAYYFFKEDESYGNQIQGREINLDYHSVNGYIKLLVQMKMQGKTTAFGYFGGVTGFHFLTKCIGTKMIYSPDPTVGGELNINENGNKFYNPFYYGAVVGFQPNAKITRVVKPSLEVKFFPSMIKRRDKDNFLNEKVIEASVMLGFHR